MFLDRSEIILFKRQLRNLRNDTEEDDLYPMTGRLKRNTASPRNTAIGLYHMVSCCGLVAKMPGYHNTTVGDFTNPHLKSVRIVCDSDTATVYHRGEEVPRKYFIRRSALDRHDLLNLLYKKIRREEEKTHARLNKRRHQTLAAKVEDLEVRFNKVDIQDEDSRMAIVAQDVPAQGTANG